MDIVQYLVQQGAIQNKVHYTDIDMFCLSDVFHNDFGTLYEIGLSHSIDMCITRGSYGYSVMFSAARS